jgi:hypothetical protein
MGLMRIVKNHAVEESGNEFESLTKQNELNLKRIKNLEAINAALNLKLERLLSKSESF